MSNGVGRPLLVLCAAEAEAIAVFVNSGVDKEMMIAYIARRDTKARRDAEPGVECMRNSPVLTKSTGKHPPENIHLARSEYRELNGGICVTCIGSETRVVEEKAGEAKSQQVNLKAIARDQGVGRDCLTSFEKWLTQLAGVCHNYYSSVLYGQVTF